MNKFFRKGYAVAELALLFLPFSVMAANDFGVPYSPDNPPVKSVTFVVDTLESALGIVYRIAIIFSVLMTLYAAFQYMTSGGSDEKVKKVHQSIVWIAIGVAVAIVAAGIPRIVNSFLRAGII